MEPAHPVNITDPNQKITLPPPAPKPQLIPLNPFVLLLLLIILVGITAFLGYQNMQLRKVISQISEGTEKVLDIRLTGCCGCPKLIFPAQIGLDGWVKYEQGKDYSGKRPLQCRGVLCAPCELLPSPKTTYSCPENGWVDCMPGSGPAKTECSPDAMNWYKNNCPNFQGGAY